MRAALVRSLGAPYACHSVAAAGRRRESEISKFAKRAQFCITC